MTTEAAMRTLDLKPPVTEATLKAAYRSLAKRYHPDRYAAFDRKVWAGERFIRVKEAYDFLRTADLETIPAATPRPARESPPPAAPASRRPSSVFDHYPDQSEFTGRDFIAWLSLWRFASALLRAVLRPLAGAAFVDSPAFQGALGCLIVVSLVPLFVFVFPVAAMLTVCFTAYVLVQKAIIAGLERMLGITIGPDSPRLGGQLAYLGILAVCGALAVPFGQYVLSRQERLDWITAGVVWTFTATLMVTALLEAGLFVRSLWLSRRLHSELTSALQLTP